MQSSSPTNRAADLSEFNQLFAQYEVAADNAELPKFLLFVQNNVECLNNGSVNDRMFNLCNRIKIVEGKDTQLLDVIMKTVRQVRIGPAHIESSRGDVMTEVISLRLTLQDLANLSLASTTMRDFMRVPLGREWARLRAEITIGLEQWKTVGIGAEVPPLPDDIDQILQSNCPYFKGKKVFQTHKLVLMPGGLSINKQGHLMRHHRKKKGREEEKIETVFKSYSRKKVLKKIGNDEVSKPYWALITTDLIPGSQKTGELAWSEELAESSAEHEALVKSCVGYEVSTTLEAITLVTMHKQCSGEKEKCLLPYKPLTYTRCAEWISDSQVYIGLFDPEEGLYVTDFKFDGGGCVGILAVRRFY